MPVRSLTLPRKTTRANTPNTVPQILPHEAEARKGPEAKSPHPSVDPTTYWQYHTVSPYLPEPYNQSFDHDDEGLRSHVAIPEQKSADVDSIHRYNAKRRHWRKTRIGI